MPTIREIDPHNEQELRAWYAVTRAAAIDGRAFPLVFGYEEAATSLRDPSDTAKHVAYAAYDGDTLVGAMKLELPRKENRDTAEWTLNVAPSHQHRGHGSALLEHGLTVAADDGRHKHLTEVDVPLGANVEEHPGSRFALKHGFTSQHTEDRLVLELPVADARLAELRDAAAAHHGDYTFVSWTGSCPGEYMQAYVDMRSAMERDVPTGELDYEPTVWDAERLRENERRLADQGFTALTTAARHSGGEFAGYTVMFVPANNPEEVYQDDTLVISSHRGHRLGAALKARNLATLRERFAERLRVHTWTDPENGPMQRINHDFGFRVVEVMHEFERIDGGVTPPDVAVR